MTTKKIKTILNNYNIKENYYNKINNLLDIINTNTNFIVFTNIDNLINIIKEQIKKEIKILFNKYNFKNNINNYICSIDDYMGPINNYKTFIEKKIEEKLNLIGFINSTLDVNNYKYINFINYSFLTLDSWLMTQYFYDIIFNEEFNEYLFEDYIFPRDNNFSKKIIENDNITFIKITFDFNNNIINNKRKERIINAIENRYLLKLINFFTQKGYNII